MSQCRSGFTLFQVASCFLLLTFALARQAQPAVVDATWNGGTGNWSTASMWSNNLVPYNGTDTYNVVIDGGKNGIGSTVSLDMTTTIDSLTVDQGDVLAIQNNRFLTIVGGTIVNNGNTNINATDSYSGLRVTGSTMFSGSGIIRMGNSGFNSIQTTTDNNTILTNDTEHTIAGSGRITGYPAELQFVNKGLVNADQTTPLMIAAQRGTENLGVMQASNGGTLQLAYGTFTNTGHVIQALDGSVVQMLTDATIVGGTLASVDSGVFQVQNGNKPTITGTIVNNATIQLNGTDSDTWLRVVGDTTLSGNGIIRMGNSSYNAIRSYSDNNTVLTNDVGHTIAGSGYITGYPAELRFVNKGLVNADQTTPLMIAAQRGMENQGVMQASNGGTMKLDYGTFTNKGVVAALDGSHVEFGTGAIMQDVNESRMLTSGVWKAVDTGAGATISVANAVDVINTIGVGATVELSGASSTFTVKGTSIDESLRTNQGTLNLLNGRTLTTSGPLTNDGALALGDAARLTVNGNYSQSTTGTLEFDVLGMGGLGSGFGQLNVLGNASLFGDIQVDFTGYTALVGDTWTLINTDGALSMNDATRHIFGLASSVQVAEVIGSNFYQLTITAVPEPSVFAMLAALGSVGVLTYLWRRRT